MCELSYTSPDGDELPVVSVPVADEALLLSEAGVVLPLEVEPPLLPLSMSETLFGLPLPVHTASLTLLPHQTQCSFAAFHAGNLSASSRCHDLPGCRAMAEGTVWLMVQQLTIGVLTCAAALSRTAAACRGSAAG